MKKTILLSFCFFLITNLIFAEKVIGTYTSAYFGKQFDIEASKLKNNKFSVYIEVGSKSDRKAMVEFKSGEIDQVNGALKQIKEKYIEWSTVAKENKVTDISKDIDVNFPKFTICWLSSEWFFSFGQKLQPQFRVLEDGRCIVSIVKKVTSSSNRYIDETIYWVFSDSQEIDKLIDQLNFEKIKLKLEENESASDLFK